MSRKRDFLIVLNDDIGCPVDFRIGTGVDDMIEQLETVAERIIVDKRRRGDSGLSLDDFKIETIPWAKSKSENSEQTKRPWERKSTNNENGSEDCADQNQRQDPTSSHT